MAGRQQPRVSHGNSRASRPCVWLIVVSLLGLLPGAFAAAAPAQDGSPMDSRLDFLFGSHEPYRRFLQDLQHAVSAGDRNQIAGMVSYPFKTHLSGSAVSLANPRQFVAHFDELLPPTSLAAITAQSFEGLFANSQGVMIGRGEVWFSGVCAARDCSMPQVMITGLNPQPSP
jgi:hypothetical protein